MKHLLSRIRCRMLLGASLIALMLVMASCSTSNPTTTTPINNTTVPPATTTNSTITTAPSTKTVLTVVNEKTSDNYSLVQLQDLPTTTGWGGTKDSTGKVSRTNQYVGVSLTRIIKNVGGMTQSQAVKIIAKDGSAVTLSYDQIYSGKIDVMNADGNTVTPITQPVVTLAYSINGKTLDATTGPIEMVVMTDATQVTDASMWLNQVVQIDILQAVTLNVSAAASLTDVLKEINTLYNKQNPNITVTPNFASSGTLQKQIEQGAPCDIFISAAATQMDALAKEDLLLTGTRKDMLNNQVVMVVPNDSTLGLTSFTDLTKDSVKKIAIGDTKSVPAGQYAQQAFDELGISSQIKSKLVLGSDVRQVLNYVESGNVEAGIVYSTDAKTSTKVKIVASAPADINAKVVYPVAVIKASKNTDVAQAYVDFLFTAKVKAIFEKYGFTPLGN